MILDSELSLCCSPWACPYISAGAMGNAAPQTAAVSPGACFPGRLFCLSKARLSTTLPARAETTCAPALLSPTPGKTPGVTQWALNEGLQKRERSRKVRRSPAMSTDGLPPAVAWKVSPRNKKFTETSPKASLGWQPQTRAPDLLQGAPGGVTSRPCRGWWGHG